MRGKGSVVMALVCGIVCAVSVFAYLQMVSADARAARDEALARYGGEQVEVCVATRDIAPGEKISTTNTTTKAWLADLLPTGAVRDFAGFEGKVVTSPIVSGEVLCETRFIEEGAAVTIPDGLCAVSIEVDTARAVGGSLSAGMNVDVYALGSTSTKRIAADVAVVAVSAKQSGAAMTVTLAVEASGVQELIACTRDAELYLTLPSGRVEREDDHE